MIKHGTLDIVAVVKSEYFMSTVRTLLLSFTVPVENLDPPSHSLE